MTKSITRSFRIDESTLKKIEEIAKKEKTSTNLLVSKLLKNYACWGYKAKGVGFIEVSKMLLKNVFHRLSEEEIKDIAKQHAEFNVADITTYIQTSFTKDSYLTSIEKWMNVNNINYQKEENSGLRYILNLDTGEKFAMFFGEFVNQVLKQFNVDAKYTINNHTITITVKPIQNEN